MYWRVAGTLLRGPADFIAFGEKYSGPSDGISMDVSNDAAEIERNYARF
jgi:hypothetical protein